MKNMRGLARILGKAVLLLLMAMPQAASGLQIDAKEWNEDVLLHDGRIIKVARKVDSTLESNLEVYILIPYNRITSRPDRYWLSFEHPDSKKRIRWQGEQHVTPAMLDIVDGIPYLVVLSLAYLNDAKEKVYSDQIYPYVFLRYEEGGLFGKWVEIPVEQFPTILVDANLSASRSKSKIPKSVVEWSKIQDARPPRQIRPFEKLPVPQDAALEILETKNSPPETVMSDEEKSQFELSMKKRDCSQLITKKPQEEYLGERFVGDSTGKVQVPYNRNQADRICEGDSIWFISYKEQGEKTVLTQYTTLTKYTSSGDLLYRIRFLSPKLLRGSTGRVNSATFRSENGYLYVDWRDSSISIKGRVSEPKVSVPIVPSWRNNGESSQDKKYPAKLSLPVPQEVVIEILKTQDFTPEWQWPVSLSELAINEKSGPGCSKLFRWANQADKSLGHRFVNDPTGQQQVPYGELAASRMCEGGGIWFIALREQPGKLVLTKYTASGDFLYRISFQKPEELSGYTGAMVDPTFHAEKGYLYFDWSHYSEHGKIGHLKGRPVAARKLKVRIPEPNAGDSIAPVVGHNGQSPPVKKNPEKMKPTGERAAVGSFRDCPTCPEMVMVPGKEYAIGKYEVTQAEWDILMSNDALNSWTIPTDPRPVIRVDMEQVQRYIVQLNQITGQNYRLPTEAEWEHACYGGSQTDYCGGNDINAVAWWGEKYVLGRHPVGQKQPNGYGLYDMSGNVWEWVDDCWKGNCEVRVIRGGSLLTPPLRVPDAYFRGQKSAGDDIGFRVLRMLPNGVK